MLISLSMRVCELVYRNIGRTRGAGRKERVLRVSPQGYRKGKEWEGSIAAAQAGQGEAFARSDVCRIFGDRRDFGRVAGNDAARPELDWSEASLGPEVANRLDRSRIARQIWPEGSAAMSTCCSRHCIGHILPHRRCDCLAFVRAYRATIAEACLTRENVRSFMMGLRREYDLSKHWYMASGELCNSAAQLLTGFGKNFLKDLQRRFQPERRCLLREADGGRFIEDRDAHVRDGIITYLVALMEESEGHAMPDRDIVYVPERDTQSQIMFVVQNGEGVEALFLGRCGVPGAEIPGHACV